MANKPKAKKAGKELGATVYAGKSGYPAGGKSAPMPAGKAGQNPPATAGLVLHDYAAAPLYTDTVAATEQESELADQLVGEVAEGGSDVHALCAAYDLKREELGRLTGFSLRALADWASGDLPSQPAKRRLHEVRRLLDALSEVVKRESIPQWLHQRNRAFGNLTPLQVIEVGEMDRLWAMVHEMGLGPLE